ncbi:flagellar motor switch protein FliG [Aquicella lusitana]|uniref:Flagellar motor switch protein FliG n=1 Tax=Aquicella lusitana TaxID=254246 RepID=A0A370G5N9_9COXI|nr:FliG C-terminal domain-containing protein [Aquicella lusitana]RDI38530.1 flagellar motor switch protein FliG [Aquicella lusitana]VVC74625.1 Flagellar motor switch protein FliG [Aquicella lusitana]
MDKIRNAAIILLGVGEKAAAEILKSMNPREVKAIIDAINNIDSITEEDLIRAINEFFTESNNSSGIDISEKEMIKNTLLTAVGSKGGGVFIQGANPDKDSWLELIREQPMDSIVHLIQDEHPQIITAFVIIVFNNISSEHGTKLIKAMPKEMQNQVFKRMTNLGYISRFAIDAVAVYFQRQLESSERNNIISVDGLETVANIVSYLDSETERQIMAELTNEDKDLGEKIQDKMFPFQRLAELDKKSLQILLSEVKNEDLVIALKGVDDRVKEIFFQNMSAKSAEILRDDLESKGPVKLAHVLDAQKNIIRTAKKLDQEEKIVLSMKTNSDIVY